MVTNIRHVLVLVTLFFCSIHSTCKKSAICPDSNNYTFQCNNALVVPAMDSIHVGDTVWVKINFPTMLTDIPTNSLIDFNSAVNLGNALGVLKFIGGSVSNPGAIYANGDFNYTIFKGSPAATSVNGVKNFLFEESNNSYSLEVGVIAQKNGIYGLTISDATGVYKRNNICTKAFFNIQFTGTNQHLYFYQNNRPGYVISDYESKHMYCFKVY